MSVVLIVEDDGTTRALALKAVSGIAGASVIAASTLAEARALCESVRPDVLVLDLELPDGLGLELLEVFDGEGRAPSVVVASAHLDRHESLIATRNGRLACVQKPIDLRRLREIVEGFLPGVDDQVAAFAPAEYVQLAGLGRHTICLDCIDDAGNVKGTIDVVEGRVWSAKSNEHHGFEAFRRLVATDGLRARLTSRPEIDADGNVNGEWQVLLMESMRMADEEGRLAVAAPSTPEASVLPPPARTSSLPSHVRESLRAGQASSLDDQVARLVEEGVRAVIDADYDRAVEKLEKARALQPQSATVLHRLERLYRLRASEGHAGPVDAAGGGNDADRSGS